MATWALAAVSAMGLVLAYLEVNALSALTSTTYGLVLLAKVAVVGGMAVVGAYNRYRLVPVVTRSAGSGGGPARSVGAAVATGQGTGFGGGTTGTTGPGTSGGASGADEPGPDRAAAWSRLRTTLRVEAAGLAAVVVLTGILVSVVPPRTAAGIGQVFTTTAKLGDRSVNLLVDPAQRGPDTLAPVLAEQRRSAG